MAASIYATPPPDLSSEDTALSDVSNTSSNTSNAKSAAAATLKELTSTQTTTTNTISNTFEETLLKTTLTTTSSSASTATTTSLTAAITTTTSTNNNNHGNSKQQQEKRTISELLKDNNNKPNDNNTTFNPTQCSSNLPYMGSSTNACHKKQNENEDNDDDDDKHQQQDNTTATTMAAVAAAANAAMQLQLLEAINDAAKKRRKQHNPSRMDEDNNTSNRNNSSASTLDYEDKLSKMFLPKSMEQLKETFELLQHQQTFENISKLQELNDQNKVSKLSDMETEQQHQQAFNNPYHTFCKECGENFENELKLNVHMLQEHNENLQGFHTSQSIIKDLTPLDILNSVKVKLERTECESPAADKNNKQESNQLQNTASSTSALTNGKDRQQQQQQWITANAMNPVGFPFPPESAAAAALQAGGYLPLLGMPGFPGVDGLNRPPLRIFNPEAFCELCNKEFCNKYFLKTHKANKHGIYDPTSDGLSTSQQQQHQNSINAMNQMFQLQMQQQHQHLQQQQQQQQQHHQMQMELAQQKLLNEQKRKDNDNIISSSSLTSNTNATTKVPLSTNNTQTQITPPAPAPVYCDICSKRFTNVFAMRRHRAKTHEQNSNNNSQRNSPSEASSHSTDSPIPSSQNQDMPVSKQFQMPEGFRQDFVLEQEEVSFTPQPRKLSPQLQQQAREANFSHDKLKRLGVTNPDTFCELCCKEYCNKYFLRTHKWKRHGIFMPPEETETSQKLPTWPFMSVASMPVNLMMAQRIMTASEANPADDNSQQPSKRIKLEQLDEVEEIKNVSNDENQENRSENNQVLSVPSTPEPNKLANESHSMSHSPETAMGLQNLQKLQTMIQQLNDFNGKRPVVCHFCGREIENQYALQAHILAEHNVGGVEGGLTALSFPSQLLMQQQALLKQSPSDSPSSLLPLMGISGTGELRCTPCERDFTNLPEFQKHIAEVHLMTNTIGSPLHEGFVTPERPINSASVPSNRPPYTITPTSSYCEICNKELCNKYFMKTHMQRMHGIEIENGAQIGGVVCNICNKELCSKYFLRVHKHNTHGIIEDGAPLPTPRQNGLNMESLQQQLIEPDSLNRNLNMSPFGSAGSEGKNESYSTSPYTEMCTICTRRFRNVKWLRNHLLSEHGASGVEKVRELDQQYGCSLSKPTSPTIKIPNGSSSSAPTNTVPSPAQLAQALQNLNAQHLLQNMPKNNMSSNFNSEQPNLQSIQIKEYKCSLCPFSTPYYAFLFIHERTHSIINNNEREQDQEDHNETVYKPEKSAEQNEESREEEKPLKMTPLRDLKTPTEIVTLDAEEDFEQVTESKQPEQENCKSYEQSLRLSSPNEITSTICREDFKKSKSPKTLFSPDKLLRDTGNDKHAERPPKGFRSIACSPIDGNWQQQLLQEIAQKSGKPASFAVPQQPDASAAHMQAFVIEPVNENHDESNVSNRFMPAIVYLPVKKPLTGTMKLSFNITPV